MLQEIQEVSKDHNCYSLLDYLINDRFVGKCVVTASLRARSVVVQQIVAEINPATPIIFCHAGTLFPESLEYKKMLYNRFGFTDVREPQSGEFEVGPGDHDHVEWMKAHYRGSQTCVQEALHLNKSLQGFECWISAVYHVTPNSDSRDRIDIEGKVIRVNPILDWPMDTVNQYMKVHDLPPHKLAKHEAWHEHDEDEGAAPSYAY